MGKTCAIINCKHNTPSPKYTCGFSTFPKHDDNLIRQWARLTGNRNLILLPKKTLIYHRYVCDCHFEEDDFVLDEKGVKILKPSICPSQLLPSERLYLSDEDINSMLKELTSFEIISTLERVPDEIQHRIITATRSKSTLKRNHSVTAKNTSVRKKQKLSVNDISSEISHSPAEVDPNDQLLSLPEPTVPIENEAETPLPQINPNGTIISMENEALISSAVLDDSGELLSILESSMSQENDGNELTSVLAKNSDPVVETQPDSCTSNSTPFTLKRNIPTDTPAATPVRKKIRKNIGLSWFLENNQDADNGTFEIPNHDHQLDSTGLTEIPILSDATKSTQSVYYVTERKLSIY